MLLITVVSFDLFAMINGAESNNSDFVINVSTNSILGYDRFNTFVDAPPENCESCAIPGSTPETFITGAHAVIYAGRVYDPEECITTFFYCIVNDGGTGGHDISHADFGDSDCDNTCLDDSSVSGMGEWFVSNGDVALDPPCGTVEHGTDPTTGICGVKHDEEAEGNCYQNESCGESSYDITHLYLSVEGNIPEGLVTVAIKYGNTYETLEVPGPGNCQDLGCEPPSGELLQAELLNFSVVKSGESSLLKWTTASEINNDFFEIQSANDVQDFHTIGNVQGAGNSTTQLSYQFTDLSPYNGVNYYRLKQVDLDGRETISPVKKVNFNKIHTVSLFPNPTVNELTISFNEYDAKVISTISVLDFNGSKVMTEEIQSETTQLNVSKMPAGTYFIQITNSTTSEIYRFIKS